MTTQQPPASALPSSPSKSGSYPYHQTDSIVTKIPRSLTIQLLVTTADHSHHLELFFIHDTITLHDQIPSHLSPLQSVSMIPSSNKLWAWAQIYLELISFFQIIDPCSLNVSNHLWSLPNLFLWSCSLFYPSVCNSLMECPLVQLTGIYLPCQRWLFTREIKIYNLDSPFMSPSPSLWALWNCLSFCESSLFFCLSSSPQSGQSQNPDIDRRWPSSVFPVYSPDTTTIVLPKLHAQVEQDGLESWLWDLTPSLHEGIKKKTLPAS